MFAISTVADFLKTVNDKVGGYLWAIFAAAIVLLIVILFIVIGCKNRRIKKLKKELKNTRTKLETDRERFDAERERFKDVCLQYETERSEYENERTKLKKESAQLKSERDKLETEKSAKSAAKPIIKPVIKTEAKPATNVDTVEFDDSANNPSEEEIEQMWQQLSYYNRPTEVSQKGGTIKFTVVYDRAKDSWVIKRNGSDRVVRRVDTKEEAMTIARALCKKYDAGLVVHKKDGKFQKH